MVRSGETRLRRGSILWPGMIISASRSMAAARLADRDHRYVRVYQPEGWFIAACGTISRSCALRLCPNRTRKYRVVRRRDVRALEWVGSPRTVAEVRKQTTAVGRADVKRQELRRRSTRNYPNNAIVCRCRTKLKASRDRAQLGTHCCDARLQTSGEPTRIALDVDPRRIAATGRWAHITVRLIDERGIECSVSSATFASP